jgi:4-azaleucine resistance transporter AzlC
MSAIAFGGSMQFVAITLLTAAFDPLQAFLLSVMVNARHIFHGLSLLDKYRGWGRCGPSSSMCSATRPSPLVSTLEPPEGVERKDFYFWISLLDYAYWIAGTALGGLVGNLITFDTTGLDFALTALFVVLFLEQWKKRANRPAGLLGMACAAAALAAFGADNLVIPAMALILALLLVLRSRLDRGEEAAS